MQFTLLDNRYEGNSSQIPVVKGQTVGKYRLNKTQVIKSRGFNLEDTHLIDFERLSRLFTLLTIVLS
ncbi:hypothetical protein [Pleurocapsa sp. PCC 7319]|uniref:hypothetical protein n=1 Tax=Pleurocapsa sp. PCC 7319 TaxID=118161 RepID=UPI00034ADB55|nr:hypothetical protein [Pleurocapsa sp. PCC 7319]